METLLPLLMFLFLFGMILSGFPVAFALGGTGVIFGLIGYAADIFYITDFGFVPSKIYGSIIQNFTLIAVPLFIAMGVTLEKSKIAEELLEAAGHLFSGIRGGLLIAIVFVGALLAAATGIVGATVVTMGVLALPSMLKRNYNPELSCGTIASSGTLGQIIPPSIVLIFLGDMMNVAVADLFAAALIPGLLLVTLYSIYIFVRVSLSPDLAPGLSENEQTLTTLEITKAFLPPILLILLVLGSILFGLASPTESAACGATGAFILALCKRKLSLQTVNSILEQTCTMTTMVFTLLVGAQVFSVVFLGLYGDELISDFLLNLELNASHVLLVSLVLIFFLGFFLDFMEICFIVVPIISPILINDFGLHPTWLAILFAINLQTSFLTPPFGFALFYLKGVAPKEISTLHIYKGIIPFVILQILALCVLYFFPRLSTWLPEILFS